MAAEYLPKCEERYVASFLAINVLEGARNWDTRTRYITCACRSDAPIMDAQKQRAASCLWAEAATLGSKGELPVRTKLVGPGTSPHHLFGSDVFGKVHNVCPLTRPVDLVCADKTVHCGH